MQLAISIFAETVPQLSVGEVAFRIALMFGFGIGAVCVLQLIARELSGWMGFVRTFPEESSDRGGIICSRVTVQLGSYRFQNSVYLRFTPVGIHMRPNIMFHKTALVPYSCLRYIMLLRPGPSVLGMQDAVVYDLVVDYPAKCEITISKKYLERVRHLMEGVPVVEEGSD